jgi:hypothetical protein
MKMGWFAFLRILAIIQISLRTTNGYTEISMHDAYHTVLSLRRMYFNREHKVGPLNDSTSGPSELFVSTLSLSLLPSLSLSDLLPLLYDHINSLLFVQSKKLQVQSGRSYSIE